jgi:hypothetical protein
MEALGKTTDDDEYYMSVFLPKKYNRKNVIFGRFVTSHLSFGKQEEDETYRTKTMPALLEQYSKLCDSILIPSSASSSLISAVSVATASSATTLTPTSALDKKEITQQQQKQPEEKQVVIVQVILAAGTYNLSWIKLVLPYILFSVDQQTSVRWVWTTQATGISPHVLVTDNWNTLVALKRGWSPLVPEQVRPFLVFLQEQLQPTVSTWSQRYVQCKDVKQMFPIDLWIDIQCNELFCWENMNYVFIPPVLRKHWAPGSKHLFPPEWSPPHPPWFMKKFAGLDRLWNVHSYSDQPPTDFSTMSKVQMGVSLMSPEKFEGGFYVSESKYMHNGDIDTKELFSKHQEQRRLHESIQFQMAWLDSGYPNQICHATPESQLLSALQKASAATTPTIQASLIICNTKTYSSDTKNEKSLPSLWMVVYDDTTEMSHPWLKDANSSHPCFESKFMGLYQSLTMTSAPTEIHNFVTRYKSQFDSKVQLPLETLEEWATHLLLWKELVEQQQSSSNAAMDPNHITWIASNHVLWDSSSSNTLLQQWKTLHQELASPSPSRIGLTLHKMGCGMVRTETFYNFTVSYTRIDS